MSYTIANHPEPLFRVAGAPWRYLPALAFASTPFVMYWGNWYKIQDTPALYWDWDVISAMGAIALILAAFAAIMAERVDRWGVIHLFAAAVSSAWIMWGQPAASGGGAALVALGAQLIWLLSALFLWSYGWSRVGWLRWVTLLPLVIANMICWLWLAHELIYVYAPEWFN